MIMKIIIVFIAYMIGNFSTSFIIGKLFADIDIRKYGSKNAGTTNVLRTLGKKAAAIVLIGDLLKGVLAVLIGRMAGGETLGLIAGIAVVIGHNWPVILGFKGGKGIATTIGVVLISIGYIGLICLIFGITILFVFKYVSLASICAIILFPVLLAFVSFDYFIFGLILCLLAVYKHKDNIRRLLNGTETKVTEKLKIK